MVFKQNGVASLCKLLRDLVAELLRAGEGVLCDCDLTAKLRNAGHNIELREHSLKAVCNECRRMRVENCLEVGAGAKDCEVEGVLGRRAVLTVNNAVGGHPHNIVSGEMSLVNARGGYPHNAVVVHYGKVAARGGGELVGVKSCHYVGNLFSRGHIEQFHLDFSLKNNI